MHDYVMKHGALKARPLTLWLALPIVLLAEWLVGAGFYGYLASFSIAFMASPGVLLAFGSAMLIHALLVKSGFAPLISAYDTPLVPAYLRTLAILVLIAFPALVRPSVCANKAMAWARTYFNHARLAAFLVLLYGCLGNHWLNWNPQHLYTMANLLLGALLLRMLATRVPDAAPLRGVWATGLSLLLGIALFVPVAEVAIRKFNIPAPLPFREMLISPYPDALHANSRSTSITSSLARDGSGPQIVNRLNNQGIRDRSFGKKESDVFRVVCIGDSYTMGMGVEAHLTFPKLLERLLPKVFPGKHFEVINLGCPGHGPFQHLVMLRDLGMSFEPDMVIHQLYTGNDYMDELARVEKLPEAFPVTYREFRTHQLNFEPWRWEYELAQRNGIVRLLGNYARQYRIWNVRPERLPSAHLKDYPRYYRPYWAEPSLRERPPLIAEAWTLMQDSVRESQAYCASKNLDYLLLVLPDQFDLYPVPNAEWASTHRVKDPALYDFDRTTREFETLFAELGVAHVCFTPLFRAAVSHGTPLLYNAEERHLSIEGHAFVAKTLADHLQESPGQRLVFHASGL